MLCSVMTELGFCKPDSGLLSPTGSPLGCEHRRQEAGPRGGRKERSHFQVLDINATAPDVAPFPSTGISHHCGGLLQPYPFFLFAEPASLFPRQLTMPGESMCGPSQRSSSSFTVCSLSSSSVQSVLCGSSRFRVLTAV